jgi:hypothetical protein
MISSQQKKGGWTKFKFLTSLTRVQILSETMGLLTNTRGSGAPPALAPPNAPPYPPWSILGPQPSSRFVSQLKRPREVSKRPLAVEKTSLRFSRKLLCLFPDWRLIDWRKECRPTSGSRREKTALGLESSRTNDAINRWTNYFCFTLFLRFLLKFLQFLKIFRKKTKKLKLRR